MKCDYGNTCKMFYPISRYELVRTFGNLLKAWRFEIKTKLINSPDFCRIGSD